MKKAQHYSSHLPVVWHALERSSGSVLELGVGLFSTPFLHYHCITHLRMLVSVDNDRKFYESVLSFEHPLHKIVHDPDWSQDQGDEFEVVLIDHAPPERRRVDLLRYAQTARFVIVHDTNRNENKYQLRELWPRFRSVVHYNKFFPQTTIVSNFVAIGEIC